MKNPIARIAAAGAVACAFVLVAPTYAQAKKSKSIQTEARWISYDADAKTITVKVNRPGRKVKDKAVAIKRGKEATFDVIPTGSILTRTSVAVNGRKGEITDIPAGKTVNIYWVVDETKPTKRFARKIDVIFSEAELLERSASD